MSTDPNQPENLDTPDEAAGNEPQLERGTYEIIKSRLQSHATELRSRLGLLNEERRSVFGSIPTELISTQRITTANNCVAQDIFPVGRSVHLWLQRPLGLENHDRAIRRFRHLQICRRQHARAVSGLAKR